MKGCEDNRTRLVDHERRGSPDNSGTAGAALGVKVGGRTLAVSLAQVLEVVRCPPVTAVPGAHAWLLGLAGLDGRPLAVVDLARLAFGTTANAGVPGGPLLVVGDGQNRAGLLVDEVLDASATPAPVPGTHGPWLREHAGSDWLVLDVAALLCEPSFLAPGAVPRPPLPPWAW